MLSRKIVDIKIENNLDRWEIIRSLIDNTRISLVLDLSKNEQSKITVEVYLVENAFNNNADLILKCDVIEPLPDDFEKKSSDCDRLKILYITGKCSSKISVLYKD